MVGVGEGNIGSGEGGVLVVVMNALFNRGKGMVLQEAERIPL